LCSFFVQPLLSASVLDQLIHNDKKIPPEYTTAENFAEIQVCSEWIDFAKEQAQSRQQHYN